MEKVSEKLSRPKTIGANAICGLWSPIFPAFGFWQFSLESVASFLTCCAIWSLNDRIRCVALISPTSDCSAVGSTWSQSLIGSRVTSSVGSWMRAWSGPSSWPVSNAPCGSRRRRFGTAIKAHALLRRSHTERLPQAGWRISMDGKGRTLDTIFTERFWRALKYEEGYWHDYANPKEARRAPGRLFRVLQPPARASVARLLHARKGLFSNSSGSPGTGERE